jgi:hypothetical protein
MTRARLWAFLAVGLPAVATLAAPMSAVDLAYQIRAGQLILQSGAVLRTDPFTFTVGGQPWLDQQWLAQVWLALVFDAGGWALVAIVHAVLAGLAFGLLLAALRARGLAARPSALLTLLAFVVCLASLAMRPQLGGIVLFALLLFLLARGGRTVWLAPLVVLAWANVHGSFVLGPFAIGLAWLERVWPRPRSLAPITSPASVELVAVGLLAILATLVNPWGGGVWSYALGLVSNPAVSRLVTEWQRTSPFTYAGFMFYASLVAAAAIAWRRRAHLSPAAALGLAGFAILGAYAERGTAWWAFAAPWLLAPALASLPADIRIVDRPRRANTFLAALVAALGVAVLPWPYRPIAGPGLPLLADAPVDLADRLAEATDPATRVLVSQAWASWAELDPGSRPVFVDSRIELFAVAVWDDYVAIAAGGQEALTLLDRWQVDAVLASQAGEPGLVRTLSGSPRWQLVVSTGEGAVFVRPGG